MATIHPIPRRVHRREIDARDGAAQALLRLAYQERLRTIRGAMLDLVCEALDSGDEPRLRAAVAAWKALPPRERTFIRRSFDFERARPEDHVPVAL